MSEWRFSCVDVLGFAGLSQLSVHIRTRFTPIVAITATVTQIFPIPQSQLAVSKDILRLLWGTEHQDWRGRAVSGQFIPSNAINYIRFWSKYLVVLISQEHKQCSVIWLTSPVAIGASTITWHFSRAVHEHEGAHEDVSMVGKTPILVSLGTKAYGRLV